MLRVLTVMAVWLAACVAARCADPLEGLWLVGGDGPVLRVCAADAAGKLDIVWEEGSRLSLRPGTVIGSATPAPQQGVYDCRIDFDPSGRRRHGKVNMVMRLNAEATAIAFEPYEQGYKFDLRALLPWWMRRRIVKKTDNRPSGLDGARRLDGMPRYLEL